MIFYKVTINKPNKLCQPTPENLFLMTGFAISAPQVKDVDRFVKFINEELATRKVNTLPLRVRFGRLFITLAAPA